jgi:serine/threonine-protein kinase/endoribonuclease IRE1
MELCECSLHDVIAVEQQRIPYTHQVRIVRELSEAVAFLHEQQIVHRDIRPKNILFKQGGYEGMVKLTDFGLSKEVHTKELNVSFSTTTAPAGTEVGSFGYYAPEHHWQGRPTAKVDIFSLGCVIFYVFSHGRRPFEDPREPDNKVMMLTNIQIGRSNVKPVQHMPEVADLVTSTIDVEAKMRPSTAQVLEHPLFWSDETRFQFLVAVGKEDDVMSSSVSARAALPPSMLPSLLSTQSRCWSDAIDERLWLHCTNTAHQGRNYDTSSTTHLLRFVRNCDAHPPPQDSQAQAVLVAHGGMASYFVGSAEVGASCFPQLVLGVRAALVRAGWNARPSLDRWFASGISTAAVQAVQAVPAVQAGEISHNNFIIASASLDTQGAVSSAIVAAQTREYDAIAGVGAGAGRAGGSSSGGGGGSGGGGSGAAASTVAAAVSNANMPIKEWLVSVSLHLACYAAAFKEYGYDDTALLVEATEEDIEEAVEALHMKKGHRRALMNALAALQSRGVGE